MGSRRQKRVGEMIQEEISDLVQQKLEDPRVSQVTVTGVDVSPDLRQARVWFSVLGTPEEVEAAAEALRKAAVLLRRELAARMSLRYTPELSFKYDPSWQRGARVDELLNQIATEPEEHDGPCGG